MKLSVPGTAMSSWLTDTEAPNATQAFAIAPGCPPELDSMALLLKTPHTQNTAHEETNMVTSSLPATFIKSKGALQDFKEQESSILTPSCRHCMLQY